MRPFGKVHNLLLLVFPEHPLVPVHALLDLAADVRDEPVDGYPQQEEAVLDGHEQQDPVALAGPGGEGLKENGTQSYVMAKEYFALFNSAAHPLVGESFRVITFRIWLNMTF